MRTNKIQHKQIIFNDEMNKDLSEIKESIRKRFNVRPSNKAIMNLLLQTYKESKPNIERKRKSRKEFLIKL